MKDLLAIALILAVGVGLGILVGTVGRQAGFLLGFAWGFVAVQVAIHRFGRFRWGGAAMTDAPAHIVVDPGRSGIAAAARQIAEIDYRLRVRKLWWRFWRRVPRDRYLNTMTHYHENTIKALHRFGNFCPYREIGGVPVTVEFREGPTC